MSTTAYTDEDVKKLLQTLVVEKKKVQELQQKVQEQNEKNSNQDELVSLRNPSLEEKVDHLQTRHQDGALKKLHDEKEIQVQKESEQTHKLKLFVLALKQKLEQVSAKFTEAEYKIANLQQELQEKNNIQDFSPSSLESEIFSLKEELSRATQKASLQEEELQRMKSALNDSYRQNLASSNAYASLDKEYTSAKNQHIALRGHLQTTQDELCKAKKELASILQQPQRFNNEEVEDSLRGELQNLKKDKEAFEERIRGYAVELEAAKADLAKIYLQLDKERSLTKEEVRQIIEEKLFIIKEKDRFKHEAETALAKQEELKRLLISAQEQQLNHKQQNDKLVKIIQEKDKRIADLNEFEQGYKKNQTHKNEIDLALHAEREYVQKMEQIQKQTIQELQKSKEQCSTLEESLRLIKEELQQSKCRESDLEHQLQSSKDNVSFLNQELLTFKDQTTSLQNQIQKEGQESQQNHQQLIQSLKKQEEIIQERSSRLHEIEKELDLIKQTLVRGIRESKEIETRYHEIVGEKAAILAKLYQAREENNNIDNELKKSRQQAFEAENNLQVQNSRVDYLQQSLDTTKAHNSILLERLSSLESSAQETINAKLELQQQLSLAKELEVSLQVSLHSTQEQVSLLDKQKQDLNNQYEQLLQLQAVDKQKIAALEEELSKLSQVAVAKNLLEEKQAKLIHEWQELSSHYKKSLEAEEEGQRKFENLANLYRDKEMLFQETSLKLSQINDDHHKLQENFLQAQGLIAEREGRIKELQHHLRNKMKETTLLTEKIEEQKSQLLEAQNNLSNDKSKIADLKASLEAQQNQEIRIQELLNESIKSAESQISKWEEKYFRIYDKWQEGENKVAEYRKRDEKYQQIEKLLSNLGNFISSPLGVPAITALNAGSIEEQTLSLQKIDNENHQEKNQEQSKTSNSLFSLSDTPLKARETLF